MRFRLLTALPAAALALALSVTRASAETRASTGSLHKIQVNGVELAYVEAGKGEPLVLIHGTLDDYRIWKPQFDELSRKFRVIAYSRRMHWPNATRGVPDYTRPQHADDLIALIEALQLGPAHLVGHSVGALVAGIAAAKKPGIARSLVLIEPAAPPFIPKSPAGKKAIEEFRGMVVSATQRYLKGEKEASAREFLEALFSPVKYETLSESHRRAIGQNLDSYIATLQDESGRTAFTCEDARKIAAPVLLLGAEKSIAFFRQILGNMHPCFSRARREQIALTGHGMLFQKPAEVAKAVSDFLSGPKP